MPERRKAYSPREIAAFEGLFDLAASGKSFSGVKVQDIATAAGMGKGTLYEYFSSKEDILSKAVLYALERVLDWMEGEIEQGFSLYQMMDHFLEAVEKETILPFSAFSALSTFTSCKQKKEFDEKNHEQIEEIFCRMRHSEKKIFALGRENGEIDPTLDDSFCEYVVVSALLGLAGRRMCAQKKLIDCGWEMARKLMERALRSPKR